MKLSPIQLEITYLISLLKTNIEICRLMNKPANYIGVCIDKLKSKFECKNRNELLIQSIIAIQSLDDHSLNKMINLYGPNPYSFKIIAK